MALPNRLRIFVFLSLEMWDPLRPKYPQKYQNTNIWRENKQKNVFRVKGSAGVYKTRVQFSGSYLSKTASTFDTERIWGDKLEPACRRFF